MTNRVYLQFFGFQVV